MVYEKIDQSSDEDSFTRVLNSCLEYHQSDNNIEQRLKAEKEIKKIFKVDRPDFLLNLIVECINEHDHRTKKEAA